MPRQMAASPRARALVPLMLTCRCVTPRGPSEGKLLPEDQVLEVNGENVRDAPRERVIELVRGSGARCVLVVAQPRSSEVRSSSSSSVFSDFGFTSSTSRPQH